MAYNPSKDQSYKAYSDALNEISKDLSELAGTVKGVVIDMSYDNKTEASSLYSIAYKALKQAENYVNEAIQTSAKAYETAHSPNKTVLVYTKEGKLAENRDATYNFPTYSRKDVRENNKHIPGFGEVYAADAEYHAPLGEGGDAYKNTMENIAQALYNKYM